MEIIDLGIDNLDPITINMSDNNTQSSSINPSFGPGIELLMNNEKKKGSATTNFNIDDLNTLEEELNDLSKSVKFGSDNEGKGNISVGSFSNEGGDDFITSTTKKMNNIGNLFGFTDNKNDSNVGKATASSINENTKTYDGYGKINDIPTDFALSSSLRMTDHEKRKKKK